MPETIRLNLQFPTHSQIPHPSTVSPYTMRHKGRIIRWNDEKGFGFIAPMLGGDDVFVHISSFSNRKRRPEGDELVTYELKPDDKGRPQAKTVVFSGEKNKAPARSSRSNAPPIFAVCYMVFVSAVVYDGRLPVEALALYVVASVVAFFAYAWDKNAAIGGYWRTQESTLHLFSLIGGWPGALAAQRLLRHKSAKESFQAAFWVTVVLNCGAIVWLLSPYGADVLGVIKAAI